MILVDSSVWIDHLRKPDIELTRLLEAEVVISHPFVIGELACGHLRRRDAFLSELTELAAAPVATHAEALAFVERHRLAGRGIGWADVHLLASAALSESGRLWTHDKRLAAVADTLGLLHRPTLH